MPRSIYVPDTHSVPIWCERELEDLLWDEEQWEMMPVPDRCGPLGVPQQDD